MTGFDDDGKRVPVVDPVFPLDDEPAPPRADLESARRWVRLLMWLASGGDARRAGERTIILATVLGLDGTPRTARQLAAALGTSPATAWRRLKRVRAEIARFSRE